MPYLRRVFTAVCLTVFLPDIAQAQTTTPWRFGAFGGPFLSGGVTWNGSGTISGLPFSASGRISSATGSGFGGFAGYQFAPYFRAELTGAYLSMSFNKFAGRVTLAGLPSSGSFNLSGHANTFAAFINGAVTPFGADALQPFGPVTPLNLFFAAGPGIAHTDAKLQSFALGPLNVPVDTGSNETILALNGVIGADMPISPTLQIGLAYQYIWTGSKHLGGGAGLSTSSGSVSGQLLRFTLTYTP